MSPTHVPVLIVGAGAAGLATSALLAKQGVGSLLVERRREVFIYPKARNLTFRSFEVFRSLGLGEAVAQLAQGVSELVVKPTLNSPSAERVIDFDHLFAEFAGLSPEAPARYCPQSMFEPILLAEARRRGNDVRYGTELVSFAQDGTGVTATIRDLGSGAEETVRADYLVAADGVRSPVRESLGIATDGHGALPLFVVFVYFRAPWRKFFPDFRDGDGVQVENSEANGLFVTAKDDLGMFITTYFPERGESVDQFTPERCRELLRAAVGEEIGLEIIEIAPWQPNERVAQRFATGRVFLVGDAAHTMPPFKGGGANTAIQSAQNLAWKLAAALRGHAGPALLDTYEAERRPVGRFNARQSLSGPVVRLLKMDVEGFALPEEEERSMFSLVAGHQYRSTAVAADLPEPGPDGVLLVDGLRGQPGTRVPHVWARRDGQRVSTLDLVDGGFVVLAGAAGEPWLAAAASASAELGFAVRAWRIGADGVVEEDEGSWARATGLAPDGALLVRPDDFVGWRAERLPSDPGAALRGALAAILGRG